MAACLLVLATPGFAIQPPAQTAPNTLLVQGQQAYEAGRLQQAKQQWQRAAHGYGQRHQPVKAALSLSYLALSYQELGQWQQAEQTIQQSLTLLEDNGAPDSVLARVLNTHGSIQLALGQPAAALATWQDATAHYEALDDPVGQLGSQLNQAQAMQTLGFYRRAHTLLEQLTNAVDDQSDLGLKADRKSTRLNSSH